MRESRGKEMFTKVNNLLKVIGNTILVNQLKINKNLKIVIKEISYIVHNDLESLFYQINEPINKNPSGRCGIYS